MAFYHIGDGLYVGGVTSTNSTKFAVDTTGKHRGIFFHRCNLHIAREITKETISNTASCIGCVGRGFVWMEEMLVGLADTCFHCSSAKATDDWGGSGTNGGNASKRHCSHASKFGGMLCGSATDGF